MDFSPAPDQQMLSLKDAFQYIKRHFSEFSPGEKIIVETEVGVGALACYDLFAQQSFGLISTGEPASDVLRIAVRLTGSSNLVPVSRLLRRTKNDCSHLSMRTVVFLCFPSGKL